MCSSKKGLSDLGFIGFVGSRLFRWHTIQTPKPTPNCSRGLRAKPVELAELQPCYEYKGFKVHKGYRAPTFKGDFVLKVQ